jgi:shikimate kinase
MTADRHIENIALIGFMGTGKSSVGRLVASHLHFAFVDTDDLIESRVGRTISEIFAQAGETAFRQIEKQIVAELAQARRMVISSGGGLATQPDNLASLKEHALIVCLWASPEAIWERVRHQGHRPLLNDPDPQGRIRTLLAAREPYYRQADVLVNTEMRSVKEVAHHVLHHYQAACPRPAAP